MNKENIFLNLNDQIYQLWNNHSDLSNFTKLPTELKYNEVSPNLIKPTEQLKNWQSNFVKTNEIHESIKKLIPFIHWKQTYDEKDVGKSFVDKYGYFELFGPTGNFLTNKMALYVIFFDTENFYTWHNHEAEEIYFVISGSAKFESKGDQSEILTPLSSRFHKSFQPHSLTTYKEKCLSLVVWKDKLDSEIKVVK